MSFVKNKIKKDIFKSSNRSLQEDEARNKKLFREKIVKHGPGFICRSCDFATGSEFEAKNHSRSCGKTRKYAIKRPKVLNCTECEEIFGSKKDLDTHYGAFHFSRNSSYLCSHCGKQFYRRSIYLVHLRIHDKNYVPAFSCDFCDFKTKDNWHLERHTLHHFRDTDVKSLNVRMPSVSKKNVQVSLTEVVSGSVCSTLYEMTLMNDESFIDTVEPVDYIDWDKKEGEMWDSFRQLGMSDVDWSVWQNVSCILGLSPFEGFLSDIVYKKEDKTEFFLVCFQERQDPTESVLANHDPVFTDINAVRPEEKTSGDNSVFMLEMLNKIVDGVVIIAERLLISNRFACENCGKSFDDNAHLKEHKGRMHSEDVSCVVCGVNFPDKFTAVVHQKKCLRVCTFPNCQYQTKHKGNFLKHQRGHQRMLRRF